MAKVDFKKELNHLYNPSAKVVAIVDVLEMNFLMIDGAGNPNTAPEYQEAVEVLYSIAYTLKFTIKKGEMALDYGVMPLEGLWWASDMTQFSVDNKEIWKWTAMIMQPDDVTQALLSQALKQVGKKKNLPALSKVRLERYHEGLSAQIMHIGPYATEGPTITKLHHFIEENGYSLRGKHHEIYLSDPRKSAPEKLRTVIRQPIERRGGKI